MPDAPEIATDRGVSIQWWYVVAIAAALWALFFATTGLEGSLSTDALDAVTLLALLAWPAMPIAMYLDMRAIREEAAWEPATKSWLVVSVLWVANVAAGLAYCLRRASALRGELPGEHWRYGVYAGLVGWVGIVAADVAVDRVGLGPLEDVVFGPVLFTVWVGFPVVLYLDAVRVRAYTDLSPNLRPLVALSAVPVLNIVLGALYVGGRWWHVRKAGPEATPTLPADEGVAATRPEPLSPWYRRAIGIYVVYFLAVMGLGSWLSPGSDLGWNLLALVVWPLFGVVFTAAYHFDRRAVQGAGVPWGWTRYLFYLSVVVPALAFWYLLLRFHKVQRARKRGLLDTNGGGEPTSTKPAESGGDAGFEWAGESGR